GRRASALPPRHHRPAPPQGPAQPEEPPVRAVKQPAPLPWRPPSKTPSHPLLKQKRARQSGPLILWRNDEDNASYRSVRRSDQASSSSFISSSLVMASSFTSATETIRSTTFSS